MAFALNIIWKIMMKYTLLVYILVLLQIHKVKSTCFLDIFCAQEDVDATCNITTHRCACSNTARYGGPKCESENKCQIDYDCRTSGDIDAECENSVCRCTHQKGFGGRYCSLQGDCFANEDCTAGGDKLAICSFSEVDTGSPTGTCCCSDPEYGGSWCREISGNKASGRCYNHLQCRKEGDNNATCVNQFCVCSGGIQSDGNTPFSGPFCEPRHLKSSDPTLNRNIVHAMASTSEQRCAILENDTIWCWGIDQVKYDYAADNITSFSNRGSNDKMCGNCSSFDENAWVCAAMNGCIWSENSYPTRPDDMSTVPVKLATPKCRSCTEITDWTENVLGNNINAETMCIQNTCKEISFPSPRIAKTSYCTNEDQYSESGKILTSNETCHWAMGKNIGIIPDEYFPGGSAYREWRFMESRLKPNASATNVKGEYIPDRENQGITKEMASHEIWTRYNVIKNAIPLNTFTCPSQDEHCCMKVGDTDYATRKECEEADWTWVPGKLMGVLSLPSFAQKTSCFSMLSKLSDADDDDDGEYIINGDRWISEIWCVPGDEKLQQLLSFGGDFSSYESTVKVAIDFDESESSSSRGKGAQCYTAFDECKATRIKRYTNYHYNSYKRCLLCKVDKTNFDPDYSSGFATPIKSVNLTDNAMCVTDRRGRVFCKGVSSVDTAYTAADHTMYNKYMKHPKGGQCKRAKKTSQSLNGESDDTLVCILRVTGVVECWGRSISIGDGSVDINLASELIKIHSNPILYNIDVSSSDHSAEVNDAVSLEDFLEDVDTVAGLSRYGFTDDGREDKDGTNNKNIAVAIPQWYDRTSPRAVDISTVAWEQITLLYEDGTFQTRKASEFEQKSRIPIQYSLPGNRKVVKIVGAASRTKLHNEDILTSGVSYALADDASLWQIRVADLEEPKDTWSIELEDVADVYPTGDDVCVVFISQTMKCKLIVPHNDTSKDYKTDGFGLLGRWRDFKQSKLNPDLMYLDKYKGYWFETKQKYDDMKGDGDNVPKSLWKWHDITALPISLSFDTNLFMDDTYLGATVTQEDDNGNTITGTVLEVLSTKSLLVQTTTEANYPSTGGTYTNTEFSTEYDTNIVVQKEFNILSKSPTSTIVRSAFPSPSITYMTGCAPLQASNREHDYPNLVHCISTGKQLLHIYGVGIGGPVVKTGRTPNVVYGLTPPVVKVGGKICSTVSVLSAHHITCRTPAITPSKENDVQAVVVTRGKWNYDNSSQYYNNSKTVLAPGGLIYTKSYILPTIVNLSGCEPAANAKIVNNIDVHHMKHLMDISISANETLTSLQNMGVSCPVTGSVANNPDTRLFIGGYNFGTSSTHTLNVTVGGIPCINAAYEVDNYIISCYVQPGMGDNNIVLVTRTGIIDSVSKTSATNGPAVHFLPPTIARVLVDCEDPINANECLKKLNTSFYNNAPMANAFGGSKLTIIGTNFGMIDPGLNLKIKFKSHMGTTTTCLAKNTKWVSNTKVTCELPSFDSRRTMWGGCATSKLGCKDSCACHQSRLKGARRCCNGWDEQCDLCETGQGGSCEVGVCHRRMNRVIVEIDNKSSDCSLAEKIFPAVSTRAAGDKQYNAEYWTCTMFGGYSVHCSDNEDGGRVCTNFRGCQFKPPAGLSSTWTDSSTPSCEPGYSVAFGYAHPTINNVIHHHANVNEVTGDDDSLKIITVGISGGNDDYISLYWEKHLTKSGIEKKQNINFDDNTISVDTQYFKTVRNGTPVYFNLPSKSSPFANISSGDWMYIIQDKNLEYLAANPNYNLIKLASSLYNSTKGIAIPLDLSTAQEEKGIPELIKGATINGLNLRMSDFTSKKVMLKVRGSSQANAMKQRNVEIVKVIDSTTALIVVPQMPFGLSGETGNDGQEYICNLDIVQFGKVGASVQVYSSLERVMIYKSPQISRVTPKQGAYIKAGAITIKGKYFGRQNLQVIIDNEKQSDVVWKSTEELLTYPLRCITDNCGHVSIAVRSNDIDSTTKDDGFEYKKPVISAIEPSRAPMTGGDTVKIRGEYFGVRSHSSVSISIAGVTCTDVRWRDGHNDAKPYLTCVLGAYTGTLARLPSIYGEILVTIGMGTSPEYGCNHMCIQNSDCDYLGCSTIPGITVSQYKCNTQGENSFCVNTVDGDENECACDENTWIQQDVFVNDGGVLFEYFACEAGTHAVALQAKCSDCQAGFAQHQRNQRVCLDCKTSTEGGYCPTKGTDINARCPPGFACPSPGVKKSCVSTNSTMDYYCPQATITPTLCPEGYYCPEAKTKESCTYVEGQSAEKTKLIKQDTQYYCPEGNKGPVKCYAGSYCLSNGATSHSCTTPDNGDPGGAIKDGIAYTCAAGVNIPSICPGGYFCDDGITKNNCPIGHRCIEGSSTPVPCDEGTVCPDGNCASCITCLGIPQAQVVASTDGRRCECKVGTFRRNNTTTTITTGLLCITCPPRTVCNKQGMTFADVELEANMWWEREYVVLQTGYESTFKIVKCPIEGTCLGGGKNNTSWSKCAVGRTGVLCVLCDEANGWYKSGTTCEQRDCAETSPLVGISLIAIVLFVWTLIACYSMSKQAPTWNNANQPVAVENEESDRTLGYLQNTGGVLMEQNIYTNRLTDANNTGIISTEGMVNAMNVARKTTMDAAAKAKESTEALRKLLANRWAIAFSDIGYTLKIMISYVQILSQLDVTINAPFPLKFKSFYRMFSVVNVDIIPILGPVDLCNLSTSFSKGFYFHLSIPPALLFCVLFVWFILSCTCCCRVCCCSRFNRYTSTSAKNAGIKLLNTVIFFMYPGLAMKCFTVFDCFKVHNTEYLTQDPSIICGSDEWNTLATVSLVAIIVYIIGIPLMYFIVLYRQRDYLISPLQLRVLGLGHIYNNPKYQSAQLKYGSLFTAYVHKYWYYDLVEMLRKCAMTGGLAMIPEGDITRCSVGLFLSVVFLHIYCNCNPQLRNMDDIVQQCSLLMLFLTFFSGLMLKISQPLEALGDDAVLDADFVGNMLIAGNIVLGVILVFLIMTVFPCSRRWMERHWFKENTDQLNNISKIIPEQNYEDFKKNDYKKTKSSRRKLMSAKVVPLGSVSSNVVGNLHEPGFNTNSNNDYLNELNTKDDDNKNDDITIKSDQTEDTDEFWSQDTDDYLNGPNTKDDDNKNDDITIKSDQTEDTDDDFWPSSFDEASSVGDSIISTNPNHQTQDTDDYLNELNTKDDDNKNDDITIKSDQTEDTDDDFWPSYSDEASSVGDSIISTDTDKFESAPEGEFVI